MISDALSALLGRLRAATGSEGSAELDVDQVRGIEAVVNCRLPDPVLAILAAKIGPLVDELGVGLGAIPRHTRQAHEANVRGDLIVFGVDPGGQVFHGFLIGAEDERISSYRPRGRQLGATNIVDWLEHHTPGVGAEVPDAPPFAARLVRAAKAEPEGPRVRHAKWGVGRLMTDEGKGDHRKIKVAFASVGLKTLKPRFVEFLDDQGE